jgi:hypothetical protein
MELGMALGKVLGTVLGMLLGLVRRVARRLAVHSLICRWSILTRITPWCSLRASWQIFLVFYSFMSPCFYREFASNFGACIEKL